MLSSYHPAGALARVFNRPSARPRKQATRPSGASLPPYYLPGFEPEQAPAPEPLAPEPSPVDDQGIEVIIEEIVEAAGHGAELAELQPAPEIDEDFHYGELLAGEAAKLLHLLRRGEWNQGGAFKANLFVLSYCLFDDASGESLGRVLDLVEGMQGQGLVKLSEFKSGASGVRCVKLRPKGRAMADRTLSPLVDQAD